MRVRTRVIDRCKPIAAVRASTEGMVHLLWVENHLKAVLSLEVIDLSEVNEGWATLLDGLFNVAGKCGVVLDVHGLELLPETSGQLMAEGTKRGQLPGQES